MPRALLISHEPQAAPGRIGRLLTDRGFEVDLHVVLADPTEPDTDFPPIEDYDAVVAFGSFSNAHDPKARAWVEPEIDFIRALVEQETPYLGVCFGGQLLAEAVGGQVVPSGVGRDEIGLVEFDELVEGPVPMGPWFTWHEDRIELPEGIEVLSRNENAVQLFRHRSAIGTQFHPEADLELVRMWTEVGADHIPSRTTAVELLADLQTNEDLLEANCRRLVDWFLEELNVVHGG
jgi:GMP synthase-like glutamine amidotransferase